MLRIKEVKTRQRYAYDFKRKVAREKWSIHIIGDMAWVKFVQITEGNPVASQQFRVLERTGGTWKIALLTAVQ